MAIKQITVFVENKQGAVVDITTALAEKNINLRALSIADTKDFGILRLIVTDNDLAVKTLSNHGYLVKVTEVVGVKISDEPGKLSAALSVLNKDNINIEYLYSFMARTEKHAYIVLRVADNESAETVLTNSGFHMITDGDIEKL